MRRLRRRKYITTIKWNSGYGGWKMKANIAGSIFLVVLKILFLLIMHFAKPRVYRANIATDNEPQPVVIFVSNGSGTETDETVSVSEGKEDSDIIDSKTDTVSEGDV